MADKNRAVKGDVSGSVNDRAANDQETRPDPKNAPLGTPDELITPEIKKHRATLESNPASRVFATLAELYRKQGMFDEAIGLCIKGLKHHPDYLSGRVVLGLAYLDKGMLREAAEELERVVSSKPDHLMAARALADVMLADGNTERAAYYFNRVLTLAPDDPEVTKKLESLAAPPDIPTILPEADEPPPDEIIEGEGLEIIESGGSSSDDSGDAPIIKDIRETLEDDGGDLSADELSDILIGAERRIHAIALPPDTVPTPEHVTPAAGIGSLPLYRAVDRLQIGIVITDLDGTVHYANRAASESHGWEKDDPIGRNITDFFPPGIFQPMTMHDILDKRSLAKDTVNVRKDGSVFPVRVTYDVVEGESGEPAYIIAAMDDLTRHRDVDGDLWQFSIKDAETGLHNRRHFLFRIAEEIKRAERIGYPLCLMVITIDNLKSYRTTGTSRKGRQAAAEIGKTIRQSIRKEVDSAYRLTEDEFAVILPTATDPKSDIVLNRLVDKMAKRLPGLAISVGTASREDHRTIEDLIDAAERAAYRQRKAPKSK